MARVSSSITPDLLMPDRFNQQNMYNIKDVDPGGGEEDFDEDNRNEVSTNMIKRVLLRRINDVIEIAIEWSFHPIFFHF